MVSVKQLSGLIDFLESHPELAVGYGSRSKEGRSTMKCLWTQCAYMLNNVSPGCVAKSADQWRLYFNEFKSKLKRKIKHQKAQAAAGATPARNEKLTPIQERLYEIVGREIEDSLSGVNLNNIEEPLMHLEPVVQMEPLLDTKPVVQSEAGASHHKPPINRPVPEELRRRRRHRHMNHHFSHEPMRKVSARLEEMERLNADATRVHAEAINRLAAAVESVAERLREPIVVVIQNSPEAEDA